MDPFTKVMLAGGAAFIFCRVFDAAWPTRDEQRGIVLSALVTLIFTIAYATSLVAH